jgi:hypothetical protein
MMPGNTPAGLGRRARQQLSCPSPGGATGPGNTPPATSYDRRGEPASLPEGGTGGAHTGYNDMHGLRLPTAQTPGAWYSPGGPGGAYGGGWADGKLIMRDRHIFRETGTTKSGTEESTDVGRPNPQHDGPPRPEYNMLNRSESWQVGTDSTRGTDNPGPHVSVPVQGQSWRTFPLGQQDGSQTVVFGPPIGEWREYGARGPIGMHGPAPDIIDPNIKRGKPQLVQAGEPGTQPGDRRLVYGGVPHGLHSPTLPSLVNTMARQAGIPQMKSPRLDRPASSKQAGQSYSQTIVSEAQAGQGISQTPRLRGAGARAGGMDRFVSRT